MKTKFGFFSMVAFVLFSCGNKNKEVKIIDNSSLGNTVKVDSTAEEKLSEAIIDSTEIKLKNFLINEYVKNDLKFLTEADHQFQYENIDLNADGKEETFIRFSSPYYCGSGGCTFLLLDSNEKLITAFTVMDAPIFVERTMKNGWSILLVKDRGVFKELSFNGKKYPSNPSVLPKAPYDAPSSNAFVLFEKEFAEGKISTF